MKLKECTKDELIFIIQRLTILDKRCLESALIDVEYQRVRDKLAEAERWAEIAKQNRDRYCEFLKKYAGKKRLDTPIEDLTEMQECLKNAENADKKYDKLMREVDAYGKEREGTK